MEPVRPRIAAPASGRGLDLPAKAELRSEVVDAGPPPAAPGTGPAPEARVALHRRGNLVLVPLLLLAVLVVVVPAVPALQGLVDPILVLFLVAVGLSRALLRCPSCGAPLGRSWPEHCRTCGTRLRSG
jgi:hypothetical protein